MKRAFAVVATLLLCALAGQKPATAGEAPRLDGPHLVAMATCKTVACIREAYAAVREHDLITNIVYYANLLRLRPSDRCAARGLLHSIPQNIEENARMSVLGTSMYPAETDKEIKTVGQALWHFDRNLAHAVKLCPRFLPEFVRYGTVALSPVSKYPNWAARVCRSNPKRFLKAFRTLSEKDQQYIAKYVIQPEGCKQIAFPEAE